MTTADLTAQQTFCETGQAIVRAERDAINALIPRIDEQFSKSCQLILNCTGRVIILGIGKSGHIGKKIAATLASTGTPSHYVHPSEASHGDLGMIMPGDIALLISNSGETHELLHLIPPIKARQIPIIAMSGAIHSTLAQEADLHLDVHVEAEAGSLGLAPTSSTTVALVMGDALALALLEARDFDSEDFARFHPGGSLGRKLLLCAHDLMHKGGDIPLNLPTDTISTALVEMTQKRLGMTVIIDAHKQLLGTFTDGDLRRALDSGHDIFTTTLQTTMTTNCSTITSDTRAALALTLMRQKKITTLIVLNESRQVSGVLHMHDILRAGVT